MERLLEREADLTALKDLVRGLSDRRGCFGLVGGEAGIGKTTLVRALRSRTEGDAEFFLGACEPLSVPVPLAPLRELAAALGETGVSDSPTGDRLALARALFGALAERAPAVAVIEDAHWADPTTLDVVRLIARRLEGTGVAVLVTYRDDEVAANPALARLLGDLAADRSVRRLLLRPLSEEAVRKLAEPADIDSGRLMRMTGGNPFLVVEAVAAGGGLPPSVRDATLARASRLTQAAREVVGAAAVIGQRVTLALLEKVAPGSTEAVEEALARGVLISYGQALGFRHELIREAIESSLSPPRRAEVHARVVAALLDQDGATDHARLAHHAELAGLTAEACRYAALAATEAERVGALRETSLQSERALRLGGGLTSIERLELLIQHSHATNFASVRLEDAVTSAREAVELAVTVGDRVRQGRALVALAWALWSLDRMLQARGAAEQAVEVLDGTGDDAALARAEATLVRMEATSFDPAVALEAGQRALQLALDTDLQETRIDITISLALARAHRGEAAALEETAQIAREAREAGLAYQTVRAYFNLVFVAGTLRRHEALEEAANEALALFEEHQTREPADAVRICRARSLLDRGKWEQARSIASSASPNRDTPVARTIEGLVAARRGEPNAVSLLEGAWQEIAHVPESSRHGEIRAALIEAAWLRGERSEALSHLQAARESPATRRFARSGAALALWGHRYGVEIERPEGAPEPVLAELAGDWRAALHAWRELQAPYDAALAALAGDEAAARTAMAELQRLGATAAARAFARTRGETGRLAPRGPRRSTRAHPAGLTQREQEVLEQLASGATNTAIAAALHLSERTVAHHVSAILGKLGVSSRLAAVQEARARGLLAKDRQAARGR